MKVETCAIAKMWLCIYLAMWVSLPYCYLKQMLLLPPLTQFLPTCFFFSLVLLSLSIALDFGSGVLTMSTNAVDAKQ